MAVYLAKDERNSMIERLRPFQEAFCSRPPASQSRFSASYSACAKHVDKVVAALPECPTKYFGPFFWNEISRLDLIAQMLTLSLEGYGVDLDATHTPSGDRWVSDGAVHGLDRFEDCHHLENLPAENKVKLIISHEKAKGRSSKPCDPVREEVIRRIENIGIPVATAPGLDALTKEARRALEHSPAFEIRFHAASTEEVVSYETRSVEVDDEFHQGTYVTPITRTVEEEVRVSSWVDRPARLELISLTARQVKEAQKAAELERRHKAYAEAKREREESLAREQEERRQRKERARQERLQRLHDDRISKLRKKYVAAGGDERRFEEHLPLLQALQPEFRLSTGLLIAATAFLALLLGIAIRAWL